MRNIRLLIEYDGTAYVGWQRQVQPNSVQQAIEEAFRGITGETVHVVGASRTDAGVHARGQVAHVHTATRLPADRLRDALNAVLPRDIAIVRADEAPESFHARFDAIGKRYDYLMLTGPVRPVFERRYAWHVTYRLDLDRMRAAAAMLLGTHDFAGFASSDHQHKNTVRTVKRCDLVETADRLLLVMEGNGFLYNMVRAVAGTLVDIGRGRLPVERVAEVLATRDRRLAGATAPACGLCLVRVEYGAETTA